MSNAMTEIFGNPALAVALIVACVSCATQLALLASTRAFCKKNRTSIVFSAARAETQKPPDQRRPRILRSTRTERELELQVHQLEMQMAENSRAGLSVERSLRACLELSDEPIRSHLERMVAELTFSNMTLTQSLQGFAERSGSRDVALLASVIAVQQETGSNLADTLDFLAQTIAEKQKMRLTLRSRIAEMNLTKCMVAAAPLLILAMCCLFIEGVADFYVSNPIGWMLLGVAAIGDIGGVFVLNRMSDIEID